MSAIIRLLPAARRRAMFKSALKADDLERLAGIAGRSDPFSDGDALFWAVDHLITAQKIDRLPELADLAQLSAPFSAQIWRALCEWGVGQADSTREALEKVYEDQTHSGFARRAARAWAMYMSLPRFVPDASGPSHHIMQFWDQDLPDDVGHEMTAWQGNDPERYSAYNIDTALGFFRRHFGTAEAKLLELADHPAIQSDYFRLGWLLVNGGIYVDADARMRPPFATLRKSFGNRTLLWFRTRAAETSVVNGFIVAPPNSPFIKAAFDRASRRLSGTNKRHVFDYAGPTTMTQTALRLFERGRLDQSATLTDGYVAQNIMGQIQAGYKADNRNWRLWQNTRT